MRTPKLRHHKPSDRAYVECKVLFNPPRKYLGAWGSEESRIEYAHILARLADLEAGLHALIPEKHASLVTVGRLCILFLKHHRRLAIKKAAANGTNPKRSEFANPKAAARPLWKLYGKRKVSKFGPLAMKGVQDEMVRRGWCRRQVNAQMGRVRRIFKWGVARELVTAEQLIAISTVEPLREGDSDAYEKPEIKPVAWKHVSRILRFVSPHVADMIRVHWLCGARPDELTRLKCAEINRKEDVWVFRPDKHKTTWRGKERFVCLGWKSQKILTKAWGDGRGYVFSPRKAMESLGRHRLGVRARFTAGSYRNAILHGFRKLVRLKGGKPKKKGQSTREWLAQYGIEYWHPNQIRHARATSVRAKYGIETAAAAIGDDIDAALIYAEQSLDLAKKVARENG